MMKEREEREKSGLTIRLADPVIYLKDVDFSGRHRTHNELSPPSMVRGILVLRLSKPTKISSIGVELTAQSTTRHPQAVGARRVEVTEEHQLYSSSTVFFRQEGGGHHTRRAMSLGPTLSRTTMEEDDASSADSDVDHEDNDPPRGRRTHDVIGSRRGTSVDLTNFHRDVVSHHATTHIPSPSYVPSADNTPDGSPTSSAANLASAQPTPPSDQGSPCQQHSLSHVQPDPLSGQRDPALATSGTGDDNTPRFPAPQRRAGQALEDFRRALRPDHDAASAWQAPPPIDTGSLASPVLSLPTRTPSRETPGRPSSSRSPDGFDDGTQRRTRSKNRFSLSAISDAILDSVRSRSPLAAKRGTEGTPTRSDVQGGEPARGRSREKGKGKNRDFSQALIKVSEVFGLEPEEGRESRDGWKEFKKGTYTYPISFAVPADSPPSLDCMYGSIVWTMTATVHRPGKFTPRMETARKINVVATPSDDATEDVESVTVNKTWEDQMVYYMSIVGRAFPIGGKIPIQLSFMPLAKIKIHRVSVVIDEKVTYYTRMQNIAKAPATTRHVLCCLKRPEKPRAPILPLTDEDLRKSPLYTLVREDLKYTGQSEGERASELASEWMGPGPWPLRFNVEILGSYGILHPTNMNKKANITVCHTLKVIIRVEKGDSDDADGSKKKVYDIVIQYPVHLLSRLCDQKYTSLPPYSLTWHSVPTGVQPASSEPGSLNIVHEVSAIDLEPSTPEYAASADGAFRTTSREREQLTRQFEQLVTGQVTETGELPPPYTAPTPPLILVNHPKTLRT